MNNSPISGLIPINDCVLVQLGQQYNNFAGGIEGKYDTRTNGVVVALPYETKGYEYLLNKLVFFEEYKEGARIKREGEQYCFIKVDDLRGFEDVKTN